MKKRGQNHPDVRSARERLAEVNAALKALDDAMNYGAAKKTRRIVTEHAALYAGLCGVDEAALLSALRAIADEALTRDHVVSEGGGGITLQRLSWKGLLGEPAVRAYEALIVEAANADFTVAASRVLKRPLEGDLGFVLDLQALSDLAGAARAPHVGLAFGDALYGESSFSTSGDVGDPIFFSRTLLRNALREMLDLSRRPCMWLTAEIRWVRFEPEHLGTERAPSVADRVGMLKWAQNEANWTGEIHRPVPTKPILSPMLVFHWTDLAPDRNRKGRMRIVSVPTHVALVGDVDIATIVHQPAKKRAAA